MHATVVSHAVKSELQELEDLQTTKVGYGWGDDNKIYKQRKKLLSEKWMQISKNELAALKPSSGVKKTKDSVSWELVKELDVQTFDDCKDDLQSIAEGLWKNDIPRGGMTTVDGEPAPWRRWVLRVGDAEPTRIRAVMVKEGKYIIQKGGKLFDAEEEGEEADEEEGEDEGEESEQVEKESAAAAAVTAAATAVGKRKRPQTTKGAAAAAAAAAPKSTAK
jgi:hypothetical protein